MPDSAKSTPKSERFGEEAFHARKRRERNHAWIFGALGAFVLLDSGLVDSRAGIGVDYGTLATRYENVFAIGDCADVPASKSGVVAHQEADVVAHNIEVAITGRGRPTTLCLHTI